MTGPQKSTEENHTAVIVGKGSLTVYDDIEAKRINVRLSERRFHEESQMPILLVFQNNDELIRLLICNSRRFLCNLLDSSEVLLSEVMKAGEAAS